jgi:Domain of unknown function (DUF4232)
MRSVLAAGVVLVAVAAGCGGTKTVTETQTSTTVQTVTVTTTAPATTTTGPAEAAACTGADLAGSFAGVPGSAGAGNIVYSLHLTNTSTSPCFVSGLPAATLLGKNGSPLPTHVSAAQPGQATAARIVLQSGDTAKADARFSPDVPSTGEQQIGACEPKSYVLRVTAPDGDAVAAPISPPTAVCGHGSLSFSVFGSAP